MHSTWRKVFTGIVVCAVAWTCYACDITRTDYGAVLTRSDKTTSCTAREFGRARLQRYICMMGTGALAVEFRGDAYRDDAAGRAFTAKLYPGCRPEFWADGVTDAGCKSGVRKTGAPPFLRDGDGAFTVTYGCTDGTRDILFSNFGADAQLANNACAPVDKRVDAYGAMDFSLRHGTDSDGTTLTIIGLDAQVAADATYNFLFKVGHYTPYFTTKLGDGAAVGSGCA